MALTFRSETMRRLSMLTGELVVTRSIVLAFIVGGVAVAQPMSRQAMSTQSASRQIIRSGGNANLPFSPAVKAGGFVYVAGTLGTDAAGAVAKGDLKAQTRQALENIATTLKAGGSSLANAASVMVYLRNASDFAAMNEVYTTFFPKDPPA